MTGTRPSVVLALGLLALAGCGPRIPASADADSSVAGAAVHSLVPTGPGDVFGLREGDVLTDWRRGGAEGSIDSPLDVRRIEIEQAPAGGLVLCAVRAGERVEIPVGSGRWEVELRPAGPDLGDGEASRVRRLLDAGAEPEAWLELAEAAARRGGVEISRWYRHRAGRAFAAAGAAEPAQAAFEAARSADGLLDSGDEALLLELEGLSWHEAGASDRARSALEAALARRREEGPATLAVAAALLDLAEVTGAGPGEPYVLEARAVFERLAPGSADLALAVHQLGNEAFSRNDLDRARGLYSEALEIRRRAIPGSYRVADSYLNLALLARRQGRLDDAERLLESARETYPAELARQSALSANLLATLLRDKGEYRRAIETWEGALAVLRREDPGSDAVAGVLNNLGNLNRGLGDLDRAEAQLRESLAIRRRLDPGGREVAESLNNLGRVAQHQGRLGEARALLEQALELKERLAPGSLSHVNTVAALGQLAADEGDFEQAEPTIRRALGMYAEISPGSLAVAENHVLLGRILEAAGRPDEAVEPWRQGLDRLDQIRMGFRFSAQERSIFGSRFQEHYRGLARLLAEHGRPEEAFELIERSGARALRTMTADVPPERPGGGPVPLAEETAPLDWPAIRRALDPGTRLIVFSVGVYETLVAVAADPSVEGPGLAVHRVPVGRQALRRKVEIFRALVARGQQHPELEPDDALLIQARELFETLLGPAAADLEPARRLVIVPDLPLHGLPFAALVRPGEPDRFVGEWKPLSYVSSGTLLARAKARRRRSAAEPSVTVYAHAGGLPQEAGGTRGALPPLPGAALEARRIAELFPGRAEVLLDDRARESALKARSNGPGGGSGTPAHYLHVATHALLDGRAPLDSALVLAPGDGEDGLLRAREVIEELRVESDLVVLSACDTGLGAELAGEGVLGLSHAFLFSGARTIVTSLWPVADDSTARWMAAFYRELRRGADRDEAVRHAQVEALAGDGPRRHPYYWAAFQLWGDWGS